MKPRPRPKVDLVRLCAIAILASACATPGSTGTPASGANPYALDGAYTARLTVGDQPFSGALSLRTDAAGVVTGSMRILSPLRIDGPVRGRIVDDLLRITITYAGADGCDSRIEGILSIERGGDAVEGPVTVNDCGEEIAGRLQVTR